MGSGLQALDSGYFNALIRFRAYEMLSFRREGLGFRGLGVQGAFRAAFTGLGGGGGIWVKVRRDCRV